MQKKKKRKALHDCTTWCSLCLQICQFRVIVSNEKQIPLNFENVCPNIFIAEPPSLIIRERSEE